MQNTGVRAACTAMYELTLKPYVFNQLRDFQSRDARLLGARNSKEPCRDIVQWLNFTKARETAANATTAMGSRLGTIA